MAGKSTRIDVVVMTDVHASVARNEWDVRLHLKVIDEDAKVSAVALNKVVLVAIPRACGLPRLTGLLDLFEGAVKVF